MTKSEPSNSPSVVAAALNASRKVAAELWSRIRAHPVRNLSILSLLAASVVGLGAGLMVLTPPADTIVSTALMLSQALAALDAGDLQQARDVAADLRLRTDIPPAEQGI